MEGRRERKGGRRELGDGGREEKGRGKEGRRELRDGGKEEKGREDGVKRWGWGVGGVERIRGRRSELRESELNDDERIRVGECIHKGNKEGEG